MHPNFSRAHGKNDIALIQLDEWIVFSSSVGPACIETDISDIRSDVELFATGLGNVASRRKLIIKKKKKFPLNLYQLI